MAQPPFAYVSIQPSMRTPAGQGGMMLGDAILKMGDACHLKDVQNTLVANRDVRIPVQCVDAQDTPRGMRATVPYGRVHCVHVWARR